MADAIMDEGQWKGYEEPVARVCQTCGGKGSKWYLEDDDMPQEEVICPDCGGTGEVRDGQPTSD